MKELEDKVVAAYRAMVAEGEVDAVITAAVKKTVTATIGTLLQSYGDFGQKLEKALKEELQIDTGRLGLPGYNAIVIDVVRGALDKQIDLVGKTFLKESLDRMLAGGTPREIKLSELVDQFKQWIRDDYSQKDHAREITAIIDELSYGSRTVYLDAKPDQRKYDCAFRLTFTVETGQVWNISLRGKDMQSSRFIGDLNGFDRTLFYLYATKSKLILNTEHPDIYHPDED